MAPRGSASRLRTTIVALSASVATGLALLVGPPVSAVQVNTGSTQYRPDQVYRDAMPAPVAQAINDLQQFRVVFGPLGQTRDALVSAGFQDPVIKARRVMVGRMDGGVCTLPIPAGGAGTGHFRFVGDWGSTFEQNTRWTAAALGDIQVLEGRNGVLAVGQTPCVYQVVRWTSRALSGEVTFESKTAATPNALPALAVDVPVAPVPGSGEVVLPDFDAPDENSSGGGGLDPDVSVADLVNGVTIESIRSQLATVQQTIGAGSTQGQGGANAPQQAAEAIAEAQSSVDAAQASVAAGASDGSISATQAAQLEAELAALEAQLQQAAAAVQVRVAGGVVTLAELAQTVGFDPTQSPVAGLKGSGVARGVTLDVRGPKTVKRGRDVSVRVQVRPASLKGTVRLVILRETAQGIKTVGAKRVTLVKGKASTKVRVARAAQRAPYSLVAAFTPVGGSRTGVTVLRPIRVS